MNIIYKGLSISIRKLCQEKNINYNTIKSAAGKKKKEMIDILIEKGYNIIKKGLHYEWKEE